MLEQHAPFVIVGPSFCLEHEETQPGSHGLFCVDQKIKKIAPIDTLRKTVPSSVKTLEFSSTSKVFPGMIDLHIHGAAGHDVMDATPEALQAISHALLKQGTTGFLATTMTESIDSLTKVLNNVAASLKGPRLSEHILGLHLEGPFLAKSRMGAQSESHIIPPSVEAFNLLQRAADGKIKIVTLAVEPSGALDLVRHLVKQKVIASIGHTNATYQEALESFNAGVSYATHLFNAMRGLHHREPGCACAIVMDDRVTAELIVDGVHLHPEMVKLAIKLKGADRVVLVTDAMRAQCLGDGEFDLGGQSVNVSGKKATLENGTLAGSVLTMREAFLNILPLVSGDYVKASAFVSANPAKVLGCFDERGSLTEGKRADLWIMNADHHIEATFFGGRRIEEGGKNG
jgi:N-acetylglucosamine-6-phosphate deacetylase